jgi:hypothetical protein
MDEPPRLSYVALALQSLIQHKARMLNKDAAVCCHLLIYGLQHADIYAHLARLLYRASVIVLRWCCVQRLGLAVTTLSVSGRDLTK